MADHLRDPCEELTASGTGGTLTLTGAVTAPSQGVRLVDARLQEIGESLSGAFPRTGGLTNLSGDFFTAIALGTAQGDLYVIVGYDGTMQAVIVTPGYVDGAAGLMNADGTGTFATDEGGTLKIALNVRARSVTATLELPVRTASAAERGSRRSALSAAAGTIQFAGVGQSVRANTRCANIATRAYCGPGNAVTIGGFVVTGTAPKRVLIRAVGPSLAAQGLGAGEVLADPTVEVHDARHDNAVVARNDNWGDNANAAEIIQTAARVGAAALAGNDTRSSALLLTLNAGVYTFVVSGQSTSSGIVLLEVYDVDSAGVSARFVNLATRVWSSTGNNVAIGGFVVTGNAPKQLLLRAVGPTLATLGLGAAEVLPDPTIELHDSAQDNAVIATNDNWADDGAAARIVAAGARVGATPFASADTTSAGLLVTLQPGVYTFIARNKHDASGVVLVEVYDAD